MIHDIQVINRRREAVAKLLHSCVCEYRVCNIESSMLTLFTVVLKFDEMHILLQDPE